MNSGFHVRLERQDDLDCYILYPCGHVATAADLQCFVREHVRVLAPFGRRVDVVIVLDMFTVAPDMLETWSVVRKDIVELYTNISIRVSSSGTLALLLKRNAPVDSPYYDSAEDIVSALELLQKKRKALGRALPTPRTQAGRT